MEEKALTVKQVAGYLQVNERTIYKLAQVGKIPCFKVAGTWRFWKKDIDDWTEKNKSKISQDRLKDISNDHKNNDFQSD